MRTVQPKWLHPMEWMTMAGWTRLNWTRYREWRVNRWWHGTFPFECFLGEEMRWNEMRTLSILQAITGDSDSGLPRDFENRLTIGRPGPLCSFKKCEHWIYFFQLWCRKQSSYFPQFLPLCFIPHFILLDISFHFPPPPPLLNSSQGSFTTESKFTNFAQLPNLSHLRAFIDWNLISFLAGALGTLTLIRREGAPWVKPQLLLHEVQNNPIRSRSKTWSLPLASFSCVMEDRILMGYS